MTEAVPHRPGRRGIHLTRRGVALLVMGALLALTGSLLDRLELTFLGAALACVVPVACLIVRAVPLPRVKARTLASDTVTVGQPFRVVVSLTGGSTAFIDSALDLTPRGVEATPDAARRGVTDVEQTVVAERRGAHRIGPMRLTLLAPFGCARRVVDVGEPAEVVAVPPVVPLRSLRGLGADDGDSPTQIERLGHGADNLIPRPYVAGDSMRRVHWRASAHHGDLMVREEERETTPHAVVQLDPAPDVWRSDDAFDIAVSACASVVARLLDDGFSTLVESTEGQSLATVADHASFESFLRTCATLERRRVRLHDENPSLRGGVVVRVGATAPRVTSRAVHVLLTADPSDEALDDAVDHGWRTAVLTRDIGSSWADALTGSPR
ncbi:DUF58 domain-containing protein [Microbacterium sp. G2-8]|uniref:DUF58 domain-containing protein n=1 Tax=Microbacterium sp. G2-8 TaxID=2842454 RepID=UPI001C8A5630|nr:DUF58 domain-containing protein [Microbacterium sp. G2-8]